MAKDDSEGVAGMNETVVSGTAENGTATDRDGRKVGSYDHDEGENEGVGRKGESSGWGENRRE